MSRSDAIAAIANREGLDSQALLSGLAASWRQAGVCVAGLLAEDGAGEGGCSAGFLRDIASGRRYSIHLDASPAGTTCHLDAAGMGAAGAGMLDQIVGADIVVLSKFGKMEAMRQGLWPTFAAAMTAGKPLLTTVSSRHLEAWTAFAPAAVWLDPAASSIERWRQAARGR